MCERERVCKRPGRKGIARRKNNQLLFETYQREHAKMDLSEEGGADVGVPKLQRCRLLIQDEVPEEVPQCSLFIILHMA